MSEEKQSPLKRLALKSEHLFDMVVYLEQPIAVGNIRG